MPTDVHVEVGGEKSTVDGRDSITLLEGSLSAYVKSSKRGRIS